MATTKLADIIVPEIFDPYVAETFPKLSAFWSSGVVRDVTGDVANQTGGSVIEMPFWKPLAAGNSVLVDTGNISPQKHTTAKASAPILNRYEAWERSDLSAILAGSDPLTALGDQVARVEADAKQAALISSCVGALVTAGANPLLLDISSLSGAAAVVDADSFLDAEQLLGDAKSKLAAVAIHSATETKLRKQNLIAYIIPSEGGEPIPFYNGKRVIIDDSLPASGGVYTSFLFAAGAIGYANVPSAGLIETESERQALVNGGQETLVRRMRYVIHPNGFQWTPLSGQPAAGHAGPTNAELDNDNWTQVYETKNCGIVAFRHKIA